MARRADQGSTSGRLSFYDHHRQGYGHMPIRQDRAVAEFMVGDYGEPGEDHGVGQGGEFAIYLYSLHVGSLGHETYLTPCVRAFSDATGSLKHFIALGALDALERADRDKTLRTNDDLTALLIGTGLYDRSEFPVGHQPVCDCCGSCRNGRKVEGGTK